MSTTVKNAADTGIDLKITRVFDASPAALFEAWTDAKQFSQWAGPGPVTGEVTKLEPRAGGAYRIVMHGTPVGDMVVGGKFKEVVRNEKLVFTWMWETKEEGTAGHDTEVTVTFRAVGKKTEMTLHHRNLASKDSRESHNHGWIGCLDKLEKFAAGK